MFPTSEGNFGDSWTEESVICSSTYQYLRVISSRSAKEETWWMYTTIVKQWPRLCTHRSILCRAVMLSPWPATGYEKHACYTWLSHHRKRLQAYKDFRAIQAASLEVWETAGILEACHWKSPLISIISEGLQKSLGHPSWGHNGHAYYWIRDETSPAKSLLWLSKMGPKSFWKTFKSWS